MLCTDYKDKYRQKPYLKLHTDVSKYSERTGVAFIFPEFQVTVGKRITGEVSVHRGNGGDSFGRSVQLVCDAKSVMLNVVARWAHSCATAQLACVWRMDLSDGAVQNDS